MRVQNVAGALVIMQNVAGALARPNTKGVPIMH